MAVFGGLNPQILYTDQVKDACLGIADNIVKIKEERTADDEKNVFVNNKHLRGDKECRSMSMEKGGK